MTTDLIYVNAVEHGTTSSQKGIAGRIAAIRAGDCIDTSMGLTPLEGLVMGTRSGDVDASVVDFISAKEGLSARGVESLLNTSSSVISLPNIDPGPRKGGTSIRRLQSSLLPFLMGLESGSGPA